MISKQTPNWNTSISKPNGREPGEIDRSKKKKNVNTKNQVSSLGILNIRLHQKRQTPSPINNVCNLISSRNAHAPPSSRRLRYLKEERNPPTSPACYTIMLRRLEAPRSLAPIVFSLSTAADLLRVVAPRRRLGLSGSATSSLSICGDELINS